MKEKNGRNRNTHPIGFSFRCDKNILARLDEMADKLGCYKRDVIERAVNEFYDKHFLNK